MAHEILNPKTVHAVTGYSHVARAGQTLYLAGQVAMDLDNRLVGPGDIRAQTRQVFTNLQNLLRACGADLHHLVKLSVILTDSASLEGFREVRNAVLSEPLPPSTLWVAEKLAHPDFLVEVEGIAVLDGAPGPA